MCPVNSHQGSELTDLNGIFIVSVNEGEFTDQKPV